MYQIIFYVPESHLDQVKDAMLARGAGKIGEYSHCAWQVLGEGQFMPLAGSNAFIGEKLQLAKVPEYKVEMICAEEYIKEVIVAIKTAHPYEQPAYFVTQIINIL